MFENFLDRKMESPLVSSLIVFGSVVIYKLLGVAGEKVANDSEEKNKTIGSVERNNDREWLTAREKGIRKGFYFEAPLEDLNVAPLSIFLGGGISSLNYTT